MANTIQIRRDTTANWTSGNPVLLAGEIAYDTTTNQIKIGDGTTAWSSLSYSASTMAEILGLTAALALKMDKEIDLTAVTSLTLDLATNTDYKVTLSADSLYDLSNIPTNIICYFLIISSNGLIQVTLPNTANDNAPALSTPIRTTGAARWITLLYDGTNRYWAISEEMS